MGDPKRLKRKYSKPDHPWKKDRIAEESKLKKEYGLKNNTEIWKFKSLLSTYRGRARRQMAATGPQSEKYTQELLQKLTRIGVLDDVLGLELKDFLERRMQTIVCRKGLGHTMRHARQLITHGHIALDGRNVGSPNHMVEAGKEAFVTFSPIGKINATHPSISLPKTEKAAAAQTAKSESS
jgi:small subunit ribosomal protein S4